jgi:hypothetical protein
MPPDWNEGADADCVRETAPLKYKIESVTRLLSQCERLSSPEVSANGLLFQQTILTILAGLGFCGQHRLGRISQTPRMNTKDRFVFIRVVSVVRG